MYLFVNQWFTLVLKYIQSFLKGHAVFFEVSKQKIRKWTNEYFDQTHPHPVHKNITFLLPPTGGEWDVEKQPKYRIKSITKL